MPLCEVSLTGTNWNTSHMTSNNTPDPAAKPKRRIFTAATLWR